MSRFLYEKSVSYQGHLIIPFVYELLNGQPIHSYSLLSEWGHKGELHKTQNPGNIYSTSVDGIIEIAKEFLDSNHQKTPAHVHKFQRSKTDYFKNRYTYRNNLIIIFHANHKYFYDHYPANELRNIAAPKIFNSEQECLRWIRQGLGGRERSPQPQSPDSKSA